MSPEPSCLIFSLEVFQLLALGYSGLYIESENKKFLAIYEDTKNLYKIITKI